MHFRPWKEVIPLIHALRFFFREDSPL